MVIDTETFIMSRITNKIALYRCAAILVSTRAHIIHISIRSLGNNYGSRYFIYLNVLYGKPTGYPIHQLQTRLSRRQGNLKPPKQIDQLDRSGRLDVGVVWEVEVPKTIYQEVSLLLKKKKEIPFVTTTKPCLRSLCILQSKTLSR